jgi:Rieske Fe-S protein
MAIAITDASAASIAEPPFPTSDPLASFSTVCPHMGGPLDQGRIQNGEITCPWHRYRFDLRNGEGRGVARVLRLCLARRGDYTKP